MGNIAHNLSQGVAVGPQDRLSDEQADNHISGSKAGNGVGLLASWGSNRGRGVGGGLGVESSRVGTQAVQES